MSGFTPGGPPTGSLPPGFGQTGPNEAAPLESFSQDMFSSSAQDNDVPPPEYEEGGYVEGSKRRLLAIYIHGFMGSGDSFQTFPAHVHRYLKVALADTHVIHTKIYPRYKTYKAIEVARDNFSQWLEPHESPTTDVVLLGHSMGGLLAADVVLMPSHNQYRHGFFRHRILGTIQLDAPLLGLHPGIILAGIGSMFRAPDTASAQPQNTPSQTPSGFTSPEPSIYSETSSLSHVPLSPSSTASPSSIQPPTALDRNYDPAFPNDVRLLDRGWWRNIVHFAKKHNSEGLVDAATKHIMSHLEFGSCLLDFNCLKLRYENLRRLEDVDDVQHAGSPDIPARVRFVQYYTVAYGFPKKVKEKPSETEPEAGLADPQVEMTPVASEKPALHKVADDEASDNLQPSVSDAPPKYDFPEPVDDVGMSTMTLLDPEPIPDDEYLAEKSSTVAEESNTAAEKSSTVAEEPSTAAEKSSTAAETTDEQPSQTLSTDEKAASGTAPSPVVESQQDTTDEAPLEAGLPPIPELPPRPGPPNLDSYPDQDSRKQAEKEWKRSQKTYEQAIKNRDKALKERQKLVEKRTKKRLIEAEKREKELQKREKELQKRRAKEQAAAAAAGPSTVAEDTGSMTMLQQVEEMAEEDGLLSPSPEPAGGRSDAPDKPPKKRKERMFCTQPSKVNGQLDPKWVKVDMGDVDQVAAHIQIFLPGPHYEKLVGDLGDTIVRWVHDDATKRTILEMQE